MLSNFFNDIIFYYLYKNCKYKKKIKSYHFQMINYICSKEVGNGAFSTVYKCFRADTKEQFAVKVFPKHNLKNEEDINRFQREINIMAFTHHENIISMRDCFSDEENFYLVMNLCKGGELSQYVEKTYVFLVTTCFY